MESMHYDVITRYKEKAERHCLDTYWQVERREFFSKLIQIQAMCVNDGA
jgi:hypothetical protein